jgi:NADH-quinone oxidoreductase subunit N
MNSFSVANYNSGLALAGPEIFLGLAACVILMLDLMLKDAQRHLTGVLAVVALLVTAVLTVMLPVHSKVVALGGMFELDRLAQVLKVVTLLTVTVVFVYSTDYLKRRQLLKGEYYVLGLFATLGGMVLISAGSLLTLYLGLELMSLCLYAMVAFDRDSGIAAESAIKYFVLGSMASGTRTSRSACTADSPATSACCSAWRFSSSASDSSWARCRSTCGFRMCTRVRPPA